jgi:hypothetical protein
LHQRNFFLFLVVQYSANFARTCPRKSFADCTFVRGGGAELTEFRTGGDAKLLLGGPKFVWRALVVHRGDGMRVSEKLPYLEARRS